MFKQKFLSVVAAVLVVFLLASCTWKEVEVRMKFAPEVGDVYQFSMTTDQTITQVLEDQVASMDQLMGFGFSFTATEEDDAGNVWVDVVYEWVQIQQSSDTGEVSYDSRDPSEEVDTLVSGFDALIGKGYAMQISPDGEILDVVGLNEMISEVMADVGIEDAELLAQFEAQFAEQYSEEALREQVGNMLVEFPEGAVKIGDTWTASATSSNLVALNVDTIYTLVAFEGNIATIDATSVISSSEDSMLDMGVYQIEYNLFGSQISTIYVDTAVGWSTNSIVTQTVTGDMIMRMNEDEVTIPLSIGSVVTMEMEEK